MITNHWNAVDPRGVEVLGLMRELGTMIDAARRGNVFAVVPGLQTGSLRTAPGRQGDRGSPGTGQRAASAGVKGRARGVAGSGGRASQRAT